LLAFFVFFFFFFNIFFFFFFFFAALPRPRYQIQRARAPHPRQDQPGQSEDPCSAAEEPTLCLAQCGGQQPQHARGGQRHDLSQVQQASPGRCRRGERVRVPRRVFRLCDVWSRPLGRVYLHRWQAVLRSLREKGLHPVSFGPSCGRPIKQCQLLLLLFVC